LLNTYWIPPNLQIARSGYGSVSGKKILTDRLWYCCQDRTATKGQIGKDWRDRTAEICLDRTARNGLSIKECQDRTQDRTTKTDEDINIVKIIIPLESLFSGAIYLKCK
jgi:predicted secreted protein